MAADWGCYRKSVVTFGSIFIGTIFVTINSTNSILTAMKNTEFVSVPENQTHPISHFIALPGIFVFKCVGEGETQSVGAGSA